MIETDRFLLRDYRAVDEAAFISYQTDPAFAIHHLPAELGEDHARSVFHLFIQWRHAVPRINYQLAICRKGDGELIGSCGVRMERQLVGEGIFGIELARPYWGRHGYALEVSVAMIDWAFAILPVQTLLADTATSNAIVARLAEKAGFKRTQLAEKQWWRLSGGDWLRAKNARHRTAAALPPRVS